MEPRDCDYIEWELKRVNKIKTSHVYPPIPDRSHDWCAYYDGHEEDNFLYGWGPTEDEAIRDLMVNCEEPE